MGDRVKFVSYTGKFPNLCRGVLTLLIDGAQHAFDVSGHFDPKGFNGLERAAARACSPGDLVLTEDSFISLSSGGTVTFDQSWRENVTHSDWRVSVSDDLIGLLPEIRKVINDNIPEGCCGGCV